MAAFRHNCHIVVRYGVLETQQMRDTMLIMPLMLTQIMTKKRKREKETNSIEWMPFNVVPRTKWQPSALDCELRDCRFDPCVGHHEKGLLICEWARCIF
jgi:hypothetical protein